MSPRAPPATDRHRVAVLADGREGPELGRGARDREGKRAKRTRRCEKRASAASAAAAVPTSASPAVAAPPACPVRPAPAIARPACRGRPRRLGALATEEARKPAAPPWTALRERAADHREHVAGDDARDGLSEKKCPHASCAWRIGCTVSRADRCSPAPCRRASPRRPCGIRRPPRAQRPTVRGPRVARSPSAKARRF